MKFTAATTIAALLWPVRLAAAATGHIYIIDAQAPPASREPSSLSPAPARLVLAQRAGVEEYHRASLESREAIEAVNAYGVRTPLFAEHEAAKRAFILLEGIDETEADIPALREHPGFRLDPAPDASASRGLWIDLAKQAQPSTYSGLSDENAIEAMRKISTSGDFFYVAKGVTDLRNVLKEAAKHAVTLYVAPPESNAQTGDNMHLWGTYTMPSTQSPLRKRSAQHPQKEAPLEEFTPPTEFPPVQSSSQPVSPFADSAPLPGILPSCFSSQSACETTTRNCTGHGQCHQKFSDPSAPAGSTQKCWTCQCLATTQKTSGGKTKTTQWGGPACQKKDVSVQFWLLALFTVALIFLVGFAVGEIWGMGNEELPSVIGAGVSGPVKR